MAADTCENCVFWEFEYAGEGVCRRMIKDRSRPGGLFRIRGKNREETYADLMLVTTEDFGCNAFRPATPRRTPDGR